MRFTVYLAVFLAALICFAFNFTCPVLAEENLTPVSFDVEQTQSPKIFTVNNNEIKISTKLDFAKNIQKEYKNPFLKNRNASLWDITEQPKEFAKLLKGGVRTEISSENKKGGFSFFNDRLEISPEFTGGIGAATNSDGGFGTAGRTRTSISALLIKDRPQGIIGEGRVNLRFNIASGINPFDNSTLSNTDDLYSDSFFPNTGVNIGRGGLSTKFAFLDNLNYTQKIHFNGLEWTQVYGVTDLGDYFDKNAFANDENTQFVNSAFVNNRAFLSNVSAFSGLWKFKRPMVSFTATASPLDPVKFDNAFSAVGEIEISPKIKGKQGHYRMGMGAILGRKVNNYFFHNGTEYIYFGFDQKITNNIGVFARYGDVGVSYASKYPFFFPVETVATHKDTNPVVSESFLFKKRKDSKGFNSIPDYIAANNNGANGLPVRQALSFGMEWDKPFGYKKGCFALAYGRNDRIFRSSNYDSVGHPVFAYADFPNHAAEHIIEIDYRHRLNKLLSITPNIQMILNKGGNKDSKMSMIFGLRTYMHF